MMLIEKDEVDYGALYCKKNSVKVLITASLVQVMQW